MDLRLGCLRHVHGVEGLLLRFLCKGDSPDLESLLSFLYNPALTPGVGSYESAGVSFCESLGGVGCLDFGAASG